MTRSAGRRASGVQTEKVLPPAPSSGRESEDSRAAPQAGSGVAWYWRLVLFLWGTSFVALLLYELLAGIIKAW